MSKSYTWTCHEMLVSGLWKFKPEVTLEQLQAVAVEWKQQEPAAWQELYIRGVGKDGAIGIGFVYELELDAPQNPDNLGEFNHNLERARRKFFHRITDQLKRQFGNDLAGWDISRPLWKLETT